MSQSCIIIGASHAASQLVLSLRSEGWEGRITVIGDEAQLPYHRPPLSKAYLSGEKSVEDILIRPETVYEKNGVDFLLGEWVESIDREQKSVTLKSGKTLPYDKLALCTGSRVREIPLPGINLKGVHYLRTVDDVDSIKADANANACAVIVGGGYIGLETAAVLKQMGMEVTVVEMEQRVLARVTAPELSEFYTRVHAEEGVNIHTGLLVTAIQGEGRVGSVLCDDGRIFNADLVVIGVGIVPNIELALTAGLAVDNGVVVDEYALTSDPDIVAAGDVTNHPNRIYGRRLRLESVPNAIEQAKSAAASLCGKQKAYEGLPWFWSDQYDIKLQIVGLSQGYDQVVVRGDRHSGRSFAAFYLREERLIATDCINRPQEFMVSKRLISQGLAVDPVQLADETVQPKALIPI